ncbi:hypothetical protein JR316_0013365 [Psilocybe cubensis]|uniref:Uncharacterized protein n=1 Tax=Psilocybe cubensis TaxID=181762 RepID=A0ACB8GHL0_PSICU|nr:hypothetical protein JR316_0013365 [Psilocybe cubensis]KAH9474897.1 hypothetical protein JR316_0013365 [Psilocybe cubensis]
MIYYPQHLRYAGIRLDTEQPLSSADHSTSTSNMKTKTKTGVRSAEWRLSVILAWITVAHFVFVALTTAYLLSTTTFPPAPSPAPLPPTPPTPTPAPTPTPTPHLPPQISAWATLLGLSSASLAAIQYAPQLAHTYRTRLVGALSVPMMCIQTPGGVLMVLSIVWRPGTNWTTWKIRQRRLGIDDFGNALLDPASSPPTSTHNATYGATDTNANANTSTTTRAGNVENVSVEEVEDIVPVPGLVTTPSEDPRAVRAVLAAALESAAESRLVDVGDERTPLLGGGGSGVVGAGAGASGSGGGVGGGTGAGSKQVSEEVKGWQAWFRRR